MLTVSQFATDIHTGKTVQVIGVQQVFGMTTYKVYEPDTGKIYNAAESTLTVESCLAQPSAAFVRFASVWCRVKNELATGTVFDVSESVIPLPHQRYALERAIATNEVRYMLADEVGLGKTIEAGLIIKELQARGLIERVLVVCPKGLMTQWEAEMLEKFGERFTIVQPEDYATLRKVAPDQNVFANLTHVISPMDAIKPLEERVGWSQEKIDQYNQDRIEAVIAGAWDLIIIDEAHRVAGQTNLLAYSMSKIPFGFMDYAQTIDWCQRGMYQAENCVEYASGLLEQALVLCKTASKHRDWDTIAKLYGKAAMIQHSGVSLANWTQARKLIEESFGTWVDQKYHLLSGSVDRKRPVLLSKVADFIRRSSSKVALVVMDGMSFENLYTIQREMVNQPIYFEIHSSFSFFPTVTSVARQSIFSGKMPSEHPTPFSLDREEKQWIAFWKSAGLRDNEIFYHKGMLDDVPFTAKALGIVVNIVDDLMHAELQGLSGIQQGLREWIKNGKLSKMFQMLMDNGFTVYMTSDHGNTAAIAEGRFAKPSVVAEPASRRAVIYDASFDARELEKFNVKRYSGAYLPEGYDAYLFSTDTCYGDTGKEYITHGGMTLEEAVVPFVRIGGKHG